MTNGIKVTKRNGTQEPFNISKVHRVLEWATENIKGVSLSEIEMKAEFSLYNGIPTTEIHELLIRSSAELISIDTPNYQYVAAKLINYKLRKEVYGSYIPIDLYSHIVKCVDNGVYDSEILEWFDEEDINTLNLHIKHDRDLNIVYAGMEQLRSKYLCQDRRTKQAYETPQMLYMLVAMTLFKDYGEGEEERTKWIKDFYDAISQFYISLPTPIMAGLRTPERQFSSCVLIECDDTLNSITASTTAIVKYISQKAGIGLSAGKIRALNSGVSNNTKVHTGLIPYLKLFQAAVKSASQGGVRGGSATVYFPFWHKDIQDLVVLKNNKGTFETRVRHVDYCFQFNGFFYSRLLENKEISLFSPHDVPGLYDSFFSDQELFKQLYEEYESNQLIKRNTIKALDLFLIFIQERKETGRIYLMNVDNANKQGPFKEELAPIRMSNLCCVTGDTPVDILVDNEPKFGFPIKDIPPLLIGHEVKVVSKNLETGMISFKPIIWADKTRNNAEILEIEDVYSGRKIRCTPDHLIHTRTRGYVRADELQEDDELTYF